MKVKAAGGAIGILQTVANILVLIVSLAFLFKVILPYEITVEKEYQPLAETPNTKAEVETPNAEPNVEPEKDNTKTEEEENKGFGFGFYGAKSPKLNKAKLGISRVERNEVITFKPNTAKVFCVFLLISFVLGACNMGMGYGLWKGKIDCE